MKIKRYVLKPGTTLDDIKAAGGKEGGSWINKDSKLFISKFFYYKPSDFGFSIGLAFTKDLSDWNDFNNVLMLDEDFCQPYVSFYGDNFGKDVENFPVLEYIITRYNEYMNSLSFLTEIK